MVEIRCAAVPILVSVNLAAGFQIECWNTDEALLVESCVGIGYGCYRLCQIPCLFPV